MVPPPSTTSVWPVIILRSSQNQRTAWANVFRQARPSEGIMRSTMFYHRLWRQSLKRREHHPRGDAVDIDGRGGEFHGNILLKTMMAAFEAQ